MLHIHKAVLAMMAAFAATVEKPPGLVLSALLPGWDRGTANHIPWDLEDTSTFDYYTETGSWDPEDYEEVLVYRIEKFMNPWCGNLLKKYDYVPPGWPETPKKTPELEAYEPPVIYTIKVMAYPQRPRAPDER